MSHVDNFANAKYGFRNIGTQICQLRLRPNPAATLIHPKRPGQRKRPRRTVRSQNHPPSNRNDRTRGGAKIEDAISVLFKTKEPMNCNATMVEAMQVEGLRTSPGVATSDANRRIDHH